MILRHLKTTYRSLRRNKIVTLINVFGMSIGLAAFILIFNWAFYEYSFDSMHEKGNRIFRVIEKQFFNGQDEKFLSSMPEWLSGTFEEEVHGIQASTALLNVGNIWFKQGEHYLEVQNVTYTNNNFFNIFTIKFLSGSPDNALSNPYSLVLTQSMAKKLFNQESALGKTIIYQDSMEYLVTGIIEDIPDNSHFQFDILVSMEERKPYWDRNDYNHTTSIYVLLDKNTDPQHLWSPLQKVKDKHMQHNAEFIEFYIQPLKDIHLRSNHTIWGQNWKKSDIRVVHAFVLVGMLVIIISSINFINLSTASYTKRYKEFGLKKIVGANRTNLILQFLSESFLLIFISFWLSLIIIEIVKPILILNQLLGQSIDHYLDFRFLPFLFLLICLITLISGTYPALILSSAKPVDLFKRNFGHKIKGFNTRRILMIVQLAITSILIICVLIINRQLKYILRKDLGFSKEEILLVRSADAFRENYESIKKELGSESSILDITSSNVSLGSSMWRNSIHFEGESENSFWVVPYMMVDFNFIDFYNMKMTKGRVFSDDQALDKMYSAFIINESLAKKLEFEDPIGVKFKTGASSWGEIIGVVQDFNYRTLHHAIEPLAIQLGSDYRNVISLKVNTKNLSQVLTQLEKVWKRYQPDQPFQFSFMDEEFNRYYFNEKRTIKVVLIFSIISIILSSVGLLGLIMFVTESKIKDIGIRKVNGASVSNILTLLSRDLLTNVSLAFIVSIPLGWYASTKWLENFAYKTMIPWWVFGIVGIFIMLIVWLTVSYFALRAARKNPVEALRYE